VGNKRTILFCCVLILGSVSLGALAGAEPVELKRGDNQIEILIGGHPFTTYFYDAKIAKAYFQPLRSAQGTIVTRGYPIGDVVPEEHVHDSSVEPHQRPLYFAHGNIDGLSFWSEEVFLQRFYDSEEQPFGRMVFTKLDEASGGADSGAIKAEFNLVGPSGRILGTETQSYTFSGDENTRTIDCEYVVHADHGPVVFGDTKEGTFAIRVAPELNSPPGRMVSSTGGEGEKQIWGKRADWVNYDGKVSGEDLGIAIFDSPKSFRHPTYWHARAYGLFAANPFGLREFLRDPKQDGSWTVEEGKSLMLRYRVVIHHGDYKQAGIADAYQRYTAEEGK
jgi:Family of unknown function (DUF6807)